MPNVNPTVWMVSMVSVSFQALLTIEVLGPLGELQLNTKTDGIQEQSIQRLGEE